MKNVLKHLLCVFLLFAAMATVCCGKRGPSLPPLRVVPRPCADLAVSQLGDTLLISFLMPDRNTDGSPLQESPRVELLLFISDADESGSVTVISRDEFLKRAKVVSSITPSDVGQFTFGGRVFLEQKVFELYGEKAEGKQFSYSVQCVTAKKKRSALSGIGSVIPILPLGTVNDLSVSVQEEGVRLEWASHSPSNDSSVRRLFNLYRAEIAADEPHTDVADSRSSERMRHLSKKLNDEPISENSFLDKTFRYGAYYLYSVREVRDASLPARESADSNIVLIRPLDIFPPSPPSGLSAVTDKESIRLFWFPSPDNDVAGYIVYRKEESEEAYKAISTLPPHLSSFSDQNAAADVRYSYYVTAFDSAQPPNESIPSETVSEMLDRAAAGEWKKKQ